MASSQCAAVDKQLCVVAACVLLNACGQCAADDEQAKSAVIKGWGGTVCRWSACRGVGSGQCAIEPRLVMQAGSVVANL